MYQEGVELVPLGTSVIKNIVCPFCKNADKRKMFKGMRKILINVVWAIHCSECGGAGPRCATLEEAMEKFANPHRTLQNAVNARNDAERKCMEDMNDLRFRLSNDIEAAKWGKRLARCIRELDGLDTASTTTDVVFDD